MRTSGHFHPEWGYLAPAPSFLRTLRTVLVAAAVGGIEALGLIAGRLDLEGRFWSAIAGLNENFSALGYVIIAIFAASWLAAAVIYRLRGLDEVEAVEG